MLVADNLWPKAARNIAKQHNGKYHNGIPTAHIDVDNVNTKRLPRYKVWCPECDKLLIGDTQ